MKPQSGRMMATCSICVRLLRPAADDTAQPPGSRLKRRYQVEPGPGLMQDTVAGYHCQEEQAGECGQLLQMPVALVPAKAPGSATTVIPHDEDGGSEQTANAKAAKRGQEIRENSSVHVFCLCSVSCPDPTKVPHLL